MRVGGEGRAEWEEEERRGRGGKLEGMGGELEMVEGQKLGAREDIV